MKLATALLTALVLAGAATSAMAAGGDCGAAKQTTAQNQQDQILPPQDARS